MEFFNTILRTTVDELQMNTHLNITTLAQLDTLLNRNLHLRERPNFSEEYRRAQLYIVLKEIQKRGLFPDISKEELARRTNIQRITLHDWLHEKSNPLLIRRLITCEKALQRFETELNPSSREHYLNPSEVYRILQLLRDNPKLDRSDILAGIVESLYKAKEMSQRVVIASLTHYHENGPQWYRGVVEAIKKQKYEIDDTLCQKPKTTSGPPEILRFGVIDNQIFIWRRSLNPDIWLNLFSTEPFHFHNQEVKHRLMDMVKCHLNLNSDAKLGSLLQQITDHPSKTTLPKISDLSRKNNRLMGESLHFFVNTLGIEFQSLQSEFKKIGRNLNIHGLGGIHNPRFPIGESFHEFRIRSIAVIASDGNISLPKKSLSYSDNDSSRIMYVKNLFFSNLGDIHYRETKDGKNTQIVMSVVVGKLLEKWGIPAGDKIIQSFRLPETVFDAPPRIRKVYLEELIPEDGSFNTTGKSGVFEWRRASLLAIGKKAAHYNFETILSPDLWHFIENQSEERIIQIGNERPRNEKILRWSHIQDLINTSVDSKQKEIAKQLERLVLENQSRLLQSESELCKSLGIDVSISPMQIHIYETGRVAVQWRGKTASQSDALRWAILSPPSSGYKRTAVEQWLSNRADAHEAKEKLRFDRLIDSDC